jgi:hypothetical protein
MYERTLQHLGLILEGMDCFLGPDPIYLVNALTARRIDFRTEEVFDLFVVFRSIDLGFFRIINYRSPTYYHSSTT